MRRYPNSAYRRIFPDRKEGTLVPLESSEDGDHYQPEPNFIEWWYFDATFEDGSHLVVILHSTLFTVLDHMPTVDLRYYPTEGPPVVAIGRFDRAAYSAAPDRCHVKIGNCLAVDEGDRYRLSLHQEPLAAELTFWPQLPGWKAGTSHLFADPATGHYFDWVVPLLRARVEGTLTVAGQQRTVVGVGYHDHNWGNVYMPAIFSHWTWGRVMVGDWTLIFFDLVGRGASPPRITPLVLGRGDEILLATNRIHIVGEERLREQRTGADYFRRLHLMTAKEPVVELTLTSQRVMEALDFAALHLPLVCHPQLRKAAEKVFYMAQGKPVAARLAAWLLGKGSYLRCQAQANLKICTSQEAHLTGDAIYEIMQFH